MGKKTENQHHTRLMLPYLGFLMRHKPDREMLHGLQSIADTHVSKHVLVSPETKNTVYQQGDDAFVATTSVNLLKQEE